jgi:uncharacterized damage-inducible protein DinB
MSPSIDPASSLIAAWRTNSRVTAYLVERLPAPLWDAPPPGDARRTVRRTAAHLHNARCMWIKTLGRENGVPVPALVPPRTVARRDLLAGLKRSGRGIEALLTFAIAEGGALPPTRAYAWRNLPLDVGHVLTYFVAHEAHHRGQIVLLARQLGHRLPKEVTGGLWLWTTRVKEG